MQTVDQCPHTVDVVGQTYTADHFDEYQTYCLGGVGCVEISETHCQHYGGSPVVPPNIPGEPVFRLEIAECQPVNVGVKTRHSVKQQREEMSKSEVRDENPEQSPVLLSMEISDEHVL